MIFLFSESPSRIILSLDEADTGRLEELAEAEGVTLSRLGRVIGDRYRITLNGDLLIDEPVGELEMKWRQGPGNLMP